MSKLFPELEFVDGSLIATDRLSATEYGASAIVATNVPSDFGPEIIAYWHEREARIAYLEAAVTLVCDESEYVSFYHEWVIPRRVLQQCRRVLAPDRTIP